MKSSVEQFYDGFGSTLLRDLVSENPRVQAIHRLYRRTITAEANTILLVGCGSGRDAWELATRIARKARIVAIDISGNNIRIAQALFSHPRVSFIKADVLVDQLDGIWQYIILPDVYEHIPEAQRPVLHQRLGRLLADDGRIILTCPTPDHQQMLRDEGDGLQIVDEDVTLDNVQTLATDIGGVVGLYRAVSLWHSNDYFHAVVERRKGLYELDPVNRVAVKANATSAPSLRVWRALRDRTGLGRILRYRRRRRIEARLRQAGISLEPTDRDA